jgi:hypothetical protein
MSGASVPDNRRSQDVKSILHAILLAAALAFKPDVALAAETIKVYKDAS